MRSPGSTTNSATVVRFSPCTSTGVRRLSPSGPAMATRRAIEPVNPGHDVAVVEADDQLHAHRHTAVQSLDDAHDVRRTVARRHEVDDPHAPFGRLVYGFQDQGQVTIPALAGANGGSRRKEPAPMFRSAEQSGKAGRRVKAGKATPIDRPLSRDEHGRLQVPEQRVILNPPFCPTTRIVLRLASIRPEIADVTSVLHLIGIATLLTADSSTPRLTTFFMVCVMHD